MVCQRLSLTLRDSAIHLACAFSNSFIDYSKVGDGFELGVTVFGYDVYLKIPQLKTSVDDWKRVLFEVPARTAVICL